MHIMPQQKDSKRISSTNNILVMTHIQNYGQHNVNSDYKKILAGVTSKLKDISLEEYLNADKEEKKRIGIISNKLTSVLNKYKTNLTLEIRTIENEISIINYSIKALKGMSINSLILLEKKITNVKIRTLIKNIISES